MARLTMALTSSRVGVQGIASIAKASPNDDSGGIESKDYVELMTHPV